MGHAGTLTEGTGMPERPSDVEAFDQDFLGSKGSRVGALLLGLQGCSPGCRGMWK